MPTEYVRISGYSLLIAMAIPVCGTEGEMRKFLRTLSPYEPSFMGPLLVIFVGERLTTEL